MFILSSPLIVLLTWLISYLIATFVSCHYVIQTFDYATVPPFGTLPPLPTPRSYQPLPAAVYQPHHAGGYQPQRVAGFQKQPAAVYQPHHAGGYQPHPAGT